MLIMILIMQAVIIAMLYDILRRKRLRGQRLRSDIAKIEQASFLSGVAWAIDRRSRGYSMNRTLALAQDLSETEDFDAMRELQALLRTPESPLYQPSMN